MQTFLYRLAILFGIGKLPKAPGTWGSLAALVIAVPLLHIISWPVFYGLSATVFMFGIAAADIHEKKTGKHDSGEVVIDEVVGQWIAIFPLPLILSFDSRLDASLATFAAFVLFRFFDILKPWPIRIIEKKIQGGLGTMVDDVAAGFLAALVLVAAGFLL